MYIYKKLVGSARARILQARLDSSSHKTRLVPPLHGAMFLFTVEVDISSKVAQLTASYVKQAFLHVTWTKIRDTGAIKQL